MSAIVKEIYDKIQQRFSGYRLDFKGESKANFIIVPKEGIREICIFLKDELSFDYLCSISGVEQKEYLEVVYHIGSVSVPDVVILKVYLPKENPEVQTIEDIFPSASLFERETWEMLGIGFAGHHNLKNLLLPEDWNGYPLRKDYKYPVEYHGILHDRGGSIDRTVKK